MLLREEEYLQLTCTMEEKKKPSQIFLNTIESTSLHLNAKKRNTHKYSRIGKHFCIGVSHKV